MTNKAVTVLPEWDLCDLYPGPQSKELYEDIDCATHEATSLQTDYRGKLHFLSGSELGAAIVRYERLHERLGRLSSYAQLKQASDLTDPEIAQFQQSLLEQVSDIRSRTLFFDLEINQLEEEGLTDKLKDPILNYYKPWIHNLRSFRPYQLADEQERLLHDKQISGALAWHRLFDETQAHMQFDLGDPALSLVDVLDQLANAPETAQRQAAGEALGAGLAESARILTLITNNLLKDKEIEDRWRCFPRPISSRNLHNAVEDSVVDALVTSVQNAYPRLSHRYYHLKASWFGVKQLDYWDRNAPLPDMEERTLSWQQAQKVVLEAYDGFSPEMGRLGRYFFAAPWIDAAPRPGKMSGAFSHPTVPNVHPYLLLNYHGRIDDVMTLAHELGHGVHQLLASKQGLLRADTPLTLAETASVFGEMLTFQSLLKAEQDPKKRRALLAGKVENMLNTVVRQISFHLFETRLHDERRQGELTAARIGEIWLEEQEASLGSALRFDENYRYFWAYIPHFIHTPFYVYAYAFGDCLVNSLYAVYQEAEEGFAEKYLELLRAGGSRHHHELLAPFGLDARDPKFWQRGLDIIDRMISELETL